LVTGIFFSLKDYSTPLGTSGFDGRAATVWTASTTHISNVDIAPAVQGGSTDGMYQFVNLFQQTDKIANRGIDYSAYAYGIGTVGYGLGGFSGAATGGDNYGIAAAGSDLTRDGLPGTLLLFGSGLVGLAGIARRRLRK